MSANLPNAQWKVLIVDDEPAARRGVRQLLADFPQFTVAGECRNGAEALIALDETQVDVVFLDVQMPGMSGFDIIRHRTPDRMPATVFLTAYDEFAVKAFEAEALDYLVKPVTSARFAATIRRLTRQLGGAATADAQELIVTTSRGTRVLKFSEIEWIEAADNYSRLWTVSRSYLLRESMAALESRAIQAGFMRVHRKAIVQMSAIRRIETVDNDYIAILQSGARVPVSRRRKAALTKAIRERGRPIN